MNEISIIEAIRQTKYVAQQKLNEILEQLSSYEHLIKERDFLLSVIDTANNQLAVLNPQEPPDIQQSAKSEGLGLLPPLKEKPVAEGGSEIIMEFNRPMKLDEIEREFHARRWKLSPKHGKEVLRFTFNKKKDIFIKMDQGFYDVKGRITQ